MNKTKITAHTLVKNEQRWIWFALMSVLDSVDEIMVWDTGSTDNTVEIIKSINSPKIKFREMGPVDAMGHTAARQQMLDESDSDWILILDGDEIWWRDSLNKCLAVIYGNPLIDGIISPFINLVGDIFHYQNPSGSSYSIAGHNGSYNIRFINCKIPGLHVENPHGRQEYRDKSETSLQNFPSEKLLFVDAPYLHTTHLLRSASRHADKSTLKRDFKYRYELGHNFTRDFIYPEVLYCPHPELVPDPWFNRGWKYIEKSTAFTPARMIKNLIFKKENRGY